MTAAASVVDNMRELFARLLPGYEARLGSVSVSRGESGRPRWACSTCMVSGSTTAGSTQGGDLATMVLPRFVHRHARCLRSSP